MGNRTLPLIVLAAATLAIPAGLGYHSAGDGIVTTDTGTQTFRTPLATPVWWDYSVVAGVPTGVQEKDAMLEVNTNQPFLVTAETFPVSSPDTPKVCLPTTTPETVVPAVVLHEITCVKDNGYSVQIHYFPWSDDPNDPDHVISPTVGTPAAPLVWRVDGMPLSYKTALIPAGHWQIWIDPAVAPPLPYDIKYRVTSASPFYYDFLGYRGCPFYAEIAPGVGDEALLGCIRGYI